MSASDHKVTFSSNQGQSALPPKADLAALAIEVR